MDVDQRSKKCIRFRGGRRRGKAFIDQQEEANVRSTSNTISLGISHYTNATSTSRGSTTTCNSYKGSTPKAGYQKGTIV
jgi:hypothetical protein